MSTTVAFQLRRRTGVRSALAALVVGRDPAVLLTLCARFGLDPTGRVFDVSDGFLLQLDESTRRPMPGAIRLTVLADRLYVPVDAELVPALLDDEAAGLTRERGLIFLPGVRVLTFDPDRPIDATTLLTALPRPAREWRPLPEVWRPAGRLAEILVDRPDETADEILEPGGDAIGTEVPRPPDAGSGSRLMGGAAFGAGVGMSWLGNTLGIKSLSQLGASWVNRAVARAPRLSEAVLGRQAAALRALLQEFRSGNLERALRLALPLGDAGTTRGAGTFAGAELPPHGASFSLRDLLDSPRSRSASIWHGEADIMAELTREYRKAAEDAIRRGDYRRAAYIYGKLLRDYEAAANALSRGGLHHEAGVLRLAKLDDRTGAARAFEAAGELDRALQLYREVGNHEAAGDLLRRMRDEEAALNEYRAAARRLAETNGGYLAAGDLLLNKAGRVELAEPCYLEGWRRRPDANAVASALRLVVLYAERADAPSLFTLADQADEFFAQAGLEGQAGLFYNELARHAAHDALAPVRDEIRTRAILGLAVKLRQRTETRNNSTAVLAGLVRAPGPWSPAVLSDAAYAVGAQLKELPATATGCVPHRRISIGAGLVTAACAAAPDTGDVFLGFENGDVFCYRPERSESIRLGNLKMPVLSVATDPFGRSVVALAARGRGPGLLSLFRKLPDGSYSERNCTRRRFLSEPWLTPVLADDNGDMIGLWDGNSVSLLDVANFCKLADLCTGRTGPVSAAFLVSPTIPERGGLSVLFHDESGWQCERYPDGRHDQTPDCWAPVRQEKSTFRSPSVSLAFTEGRSSILLATLGPGGLVYWLALERTAEGPFFCKLLTPVPRQTGFLAATLLPTGHLAAVSANSIVWMRRREGSKAEVIETTEHCNPSTVACFASHPARELVIVSHNGFITRIPYPARLAW